MNPLGKESEALPLKALAHPISILHWLVKMTIGCSMNQNIILNFERLGFEQLNIFCCQEFCLVFKLWILCFEAKENISILGVGHSINERENMCIKYWSLYCHINFTFSSQIPHLWVLKDLDLRIYLRYLSTSDPSHDLLRILILFFK